MLLGFQMTKRAQTSAVQAFPIKQMISRIRFGLPGKARPKWEPGRKSSSTSWSNQTKLKLITFTGRFNAFSTGRKPIARQKAILTQLAKAKRNYRTERVRKT